LIALPAPTLSPSVVADDKEYLLVSSNRPSNNMSSHPSMVASRPAVRAGTIFFSVCAFHNFFPQLYGFENTYPLSFPPFSF
jgi:hypothetical protein